METLPDIIHVRKITVEEFAENKAVNSLFDEALDKLVAARTRAKIFHNSLRLKYGISGTPYIKGLSLTEL